MSYDKPRQCIKKQRPPGHLCCDGHAKYSNCIQMKEWLLSAAPATGARGLRVRVLVMAKG